MPYVNIPESQLLPAIAKILGKVEGEITSKVQNEAFKMATSIASKGCPASLGRLSNKVNGLNGGISKITDRISKFQKLPKALKAPVGGLKAAKNLILALPVPQAVPPGIGLPVNVTTKYADLLHLLKEFIKQISDDVEGLTILLKLPTFSLSFVTRRLSKISNAINVCKVENALKDILEKEELTFEEMVELGLISDDGSFITSDLSKRAVDLDTYGSLSVNEISEKTGLSPDEVAQQLRDGNNLDPTDDINNQLLDILNKLEGTGLDGLRELLDDFNAEDDTSVADDDKYLHRGPNGELYRLVIKIDPESPSIAPRRFAVALDSEGVEILKGGKSFSSSVDILLDEIKFRIDNQLP